MATDDVKIVILKVRTGYKFEVYAKSREDGFKDDKMRVLVATGHRSTRDLAETAAAREAAVYKRMRKGGKPKEKKR